MSRQYIDKRLAAEAIVEKFQNMVSEWGVRSLVGELPSNKDVQEIVQLIKSAKVVLPDD